MAWWPTLGSQQVRETFVDKKIPHGLNDEQQSGLGVIGFLGQQPLLIGFPLVDAKEVVGIQATGTAFRPTMLCRMPLRWRRRMSRRRRIAPIFCP